MKPRVFNIHPPEILAHIWRDEIATLGEVRSNPFDRDWLKKGGRAATDIGGNESLDGWNL
jgi:hypothetical protein